MYKAKKSPLMISPIVNHFKISPRKIHKDRSTHQEIPDGAFGMYGKTISAFVPGTNPSQIVVVHTDKIVTFKNEFQGNSAVMSVSG